MKATTSGYANSALGASSLTTNTTGWFNTAIGQAALSLNTTGNYNTALGQNSLGATTTGSSNTSVGCQASYSNSTGGNNVAVGFQALYTNTTSSDCVAIGEETLYLNTGAQNTGVGRLALFSNTSGTYNTAVGFQAGYGNQTGTYNTYIGYQAGYNGTGSNNVVVCNYYCNAGTASDSNYIQIASVAASVAKGSSTGYINPNGGGVYQGNNGATWSVVSDQRLKKNIVDNNVGLDKVAQIQVRNFEYRLPEEVTELPQNQAIKKEGVQLGVIAQELQQILPDCVKLESTGVLALEHDNIMWHMINAIKELNAKVIALETKLGV